MSTQEQVNASAAQYVLYYMGHVQEDPTVYPTDLSGVCNLAYTEGNLPEVVCNDWSVEDYPAPSNSDLLSYAPADVFTWYDGFYANPAAIEASQFFKITSAKLADVRTTANTTGYKVYNTTLKRVQYFNGTNWVSEW